MTAEENAEATNREREKVQLTLRTAKALGYDLLYADTTSALFVKHVHYRCFHYKKDAVRFKAELDDTYVPKPKEPDIELTPMPRRAYRWKVQWKGFAPDKCAERADH